MDDRFRFAGSLWLWIAKVYFVGAVVVGVSSLFLQRIGYSLHDWSLALLVLGLTIDALSLVALIAGRIFGRLPSGVPGLAWILYLASASMSPQPWLLSLQGTIGKVVAQELEFLLLSAVHVAIHLGCVLLQRLEVQS